MAIVFTRELSTTKLNLAYNNNVVKFSTNSVFNPLSATVAIGLDTITLYPDPLGNFYYNFKELVTTLLNTDNFKDDLNSDLDLGYTYDWASKVYLNQNVITTIYLNNDTTETDTRSIHWLSGFVNLREWKANSPADDLLTTKTWLLQKSIKDEYFDFYCKYWSGYPFDLTLFKNPSGALTVLNRTNAIDYEFDTVSAVSRLVFSDGRTDVSIEDVIPFQSGINDLDFDGDFNMYLDKITTHCPNGVYLKWINSFGGWNYWLFNRGQENTATKENGFLFNDYENLSDTISPLVSLGKSSETTITVRQNMITEYDKLILSDLIDSAKVYLFTGVPFSKNTFNDWVEVNLKAGSFRIAETRDRLQTLTFNLELPLNITRTL